MDGAVIEEDAFEPRQVEEPNVTLAADRGDGVPFLVARHPPRRQRRAADEQHARALVHCGLQDVEVEPPLAVGDPERDEARDGADEPHPIYHARVGRVGEDDLVAGIGEAEERVEHPVALAARNHNLAAPVIARPAAALDVGRHRLLQVVAAGERQPTVRLVLADCRPGRLHRLGGRRDVRVEVLQAQNLRVVARRGGNPIDVESRNLIRTRHFHPLLLSLQWSLIW